MRHFFIVRHHFLISTLHYSIRMHHFFIVRHHFLIGTYHYSIRSHHLSIVMYYNAIRRHYSFIVKHHNTIRRPYSNINFTIFLNVKLYVFLVSLFNLCVYVLMRFGFISGKLVTAGEKNDITDSLVSIIGSKISI